MAGGSELASFYTPDAVQYEFPNKLTPTTATRTLADILAAAERGRKVLTGQTFDILNAVVSGDRMAAELQWTGTLAVPVGALPAGGVMKARFAMFFELRDGRIAAQRNYDCFDPF
jgi:ketosteroid isomerase-like protein